MNPSGGQITFFFSLHTDSDQDLVSTPRELLNISQKTNLSRMVSQLFQLPHYVKARRHFISKLKKSDIQHTHPCVLICFSRVQLFETLWTIGHLARLSMGFSRQEYWSVLPCPPLGDLPNPEMESMSLTSPALAGRFFTSSVICKAPYRLQSLTFHTVFCEVHYLYTYIKRL